MSLFKEKKSFFGRLSEKIGDVIMARAEVDEDLMDELEEVLITSDIGMDTTMRIMEELRSKIKNDNITNEILDIIYNSNLSSYELTTNKLITVNNKNSYLNINKNSIGIKTGYTSKAQECLVSAATKNNMTLYAVILGSERNSSGTSTRYTDITKLFNFGFNNYLFK